MKTHTHGYLAIFSVFLLICFIACNTAPEPPATPGNTTKAPEPTAPPAKTAPDPTIDHPLLKKYTSFTLTTDTSVLTEKERAMIPLLIDVARIMDRIFWTEAYGDRDRLLEGIRDEGLRAFAEINYGPWDRLDNNKSFIEGVGPKPEGARFYPEEITREEVEKAGDPALTSLYTLVRRNENGSLYSIPYHEAYKDLVAQASEKLKQAAELAEDPGLKKYLTLRADALLTDDYLASDLAWMDMKTNTIDFVVGPIEVYEDKLFNYKAAHEAYVLVKDKAWSGRLARYAALLGGLQRGLPVDEPYKRETPGSDSDLNAYDVIYYAGDCNAGSKTIAINLPNDERVQLQKGTRRLQLKNAMKAKFDKILIPIAEVLIAQDQRRHITFDAFFSNTMFHEVAHGLGIKNTINGKGTVRAVLKEQGSAMEEGKADILGLYMISKLLEGGELEGDIRDFYVTFIAGIFRSVRFGAASAHGRANMLRFNFFQEMGAFVRDPGTGLYSVDFRKMETAMTALTQQILTLQGDGNYEGVVKLMEEKGKVGDQLEADLARLEQAGIPTDIVFKQGIRYLDL